jgi:hypothetical protein
VSKIANPNLERERERERELRGSLGKRLEKGKERKLREGRVGLSRRRNLKRAQGVNLLSKFLSILSFCC